MLEDPMEVLLCERVNDLRHSLFHLLNYLITTASEHRELPKVTGSKVWTIGRLKNCLDAHLGQIVSDKDAVVDWCIVLLEMPLTRFEVCWLFSDGISSWTPLQPQHSNPTPNLLANKLWCIDFLTPPTPLIIPHRLSACLKSLMPLKNWCSIHARCSKSSLKHPIRFSGILFQVENRILLHIVLLKCPHVQIAFLKFTSYDNQALVGCIPIAAVAVHLKLKS